MSRNVSSGGGGLRPPFLLLGMLIKSTSQQLPIFVYYHPPTLTGCTWGGNRTRTGKCPQDFLTIYSFHCHFRVCSLDYTLTISFDLGPPCLVSTPSSFEAWLGITILKASPNLRSSTKKVSFFALKFTCQVRRVYLFHHSTINLYNL